ncbi:MAG: hypothetical protein KJ666_00065 [Bacteroidetes bacterium]|nr:hypothetical protein [Bacteroidota bacterium]
MAIFLTQTEADFFFAMEKIPESSEVYTYPLSGDKLLIPFTSLDKRENFLFDINRASIRITKVTYQNRVRKSFVLRRLDLDGSPHANPEVENVPEIF